MSLEAVSTAGVFSHIESTVSRLLTESSREDLKLETSTIAGQWMNWDAGCFSDTACLVFQTALVRSRNSCSTSLGAQYLRVE